MAENSAIGTIGIANGGFGSILYPVAGSVVICDGTTIECASSGIAGEILVSQGDGPPVWLPNGAPVTTYTPAVPANWNTQPTTVQQGLDELATSGVVKAEAANTVLSGPTSGGAVVPTFRSLVIADIPNLSSLYVTQSEVAQPNGVASLDGTTHIPVVQIPNLSATYVTQSEVGAANGVASLDGSGKILLTQLPSVVMEYQGSWNPSTNTPTLSDGTGTAGYVYYVSAAFAGPIAGLTDSSMVNFQLGDLVIYSSAISKWQLVTPAAGVSYVNGAQGAVTVNAINQLTGDVTAGPATMSQSVASSLVATSNGTLTTLSALTTASSLASVGTITSGTWNGTVTAGSSFLTSGTTYTTPANITSKTLFKFTLVGAGGGGGGIDTSAQGAPGGGGGGVGILYITGLSASTAYTISIGAGGAGGAGTGATTGTSGGNTTLTIGATTYTTGGGAGSPALSGNTNGGAGGTATGFTINLPGQKGGGTQGGASGVASGNGGNAIGWGAGGAGQLINSTGFNGTGFGAGGSGGHGNSSSAGGSGTNGCILVEWQN